MIKKIGLFFVLLFSTSMNLMAQSETKIIAHRGAWKEFNLPENSIDSIRSF